MGVPVTLAELMYPSEEWMVKKKKRNCIKVIFPQGSQMTYKAVGKDSMVRLNSLGREVQIYEHISNVKSSSS